jgi:hypothetical protein
MQMDEATYWDLLNAISAARSLTELKSLEQQIQAQLPSERRASLGEVVFMQRRMLEAAAVPQPADGAA